MPSCVLPNKNYYSIHNQNCSVIRMGCPNWMPRFGELRRMQQRGREVKNGVNQNHGHTLLFNYKTPTPLTYHAAFWSNAHKLQTEIVLLSHMTSTLRVAIATKQLCRKPTYTLFSFTCTLLSHIAIVIWNALPIVVYAEKKPSIHCKILLFCGKRLIASSMKANGEP